MRVFPIAVAAAALTVCTTTVSFADTGDELFKLLPGDGEANDQFGCCEAIAGSTCVVGAHYDDDHGDNSGAAYLFEVTTGQQIAKLLAGDINLHDHFGNSVAIRGTTAIVGAWREGSSSGTDAGNGAAYLFNCDPGSPELGNEIAKLTASDGAKDDNFGCSVAISGTTAIVGAYRDDDNGPESGSAYVFDATTGQQLFKLLPSDGDANDQFGVSVAISGATAIVGAFADDDNGDNSGSAYLFDVATGSQIAKLTPSDGHDDAYFGYSIAIQDSTAIVGAYRHDVEGNNRAGSAYVFSFDGTSWVEEQKLSPPDPEGNGYFSYSLALDRGTAVFGSPDYNECGDDEFSDSGKAYLFQYHPSQPFGARWVLELQMVGSDCDDRDWFGHSVALSRGHVVIGAIYDDDNGDDSGSAYLFDVRSLALESIDISRTRYDRSTAVTLNGYGFADGTGTTVLFDDVPATNVVVVDDNTITCDTPVVEPGQIDVDVTVTNDIGSDTLVDAFTFTPALQLSGNWVVGGDLTLTYLLDPQDSIFAIYGLPPVFGIDTPPFDGQLSILPFYTFFILTGWPFDTWDQTFGIPNNPNLSGLDVLFQGLIGPSFGNPKDAAWTNCATLSIQ